MARPDFKSFKEKALDRPDVVEEYERLSPAADYAEVMGYELKIDFVPQHSQKHNKSLLRTAEKHRR